MFKCLRAEKVWDPASLHRRKGVMKGLCLNGRHLVPGGLALESSGRTG